MNRRGFLRAALMTAAAIATVPAARVVRAVAEAPAPDRRPSLREDAARGMKGLLQAAYDEIDAAVDRLLMTAGNWTNSATPSAAWAVA